MLKQTVSYTDFNDNQKTDTLYFHITRTELLDHLDLKDALTNLQTRLSEDPDSPVMMEDMLEIIALVKRFVKMGYGVRSGDGSKFTKNETVWEEFSSSAAYDAFVYSLFENPERAVAFLQGLVPKELQETIKESAEKEEAPVVSPLITQKDDIAEMEAKLAAMKASQAL